jgi:hypothetical protein
MTTIREAFRKWVYPVAGIWFLLFAAQAITKSDILEIVVVIGAIVVGVCFLAAS